MHIWEIMLVSAGVALNVFAVSVCWGAVLPAINKKWLILVTILLGLWQGGAMLLGRGVVNLPIFEGNTTFLTGSGSRLSVLIFMGLGLYMFFRSSRAGALNERRRDAYGIKEAFLLAITISIDAFLVGIGMGFLRSRIGVSALCFVLITMLAVVLGTYTGFWMGSEKRRVAYQIGGAMMVFSGVELLAGLIF